MNTYSTIFGDGPDLVTTAVMLSSLHESFRIEATLPADGHYITLRFAARHFELEYCLQLKHRGKHPWTIDRRCDAINSWWETGIAQCTDCPPRSWVLLIDLIDPEVARQTFIFPSLRHDCDGSKSQISSDSFSRPRICV